MIQSTKLAKATYWLSGKLSRVRTPQRRFEMTVTRPGDVGDLADMFTKLPGRTWSSCRWTWKVLGLACRLDQKHFDHWALDHSDHIDTCDDCIECNGFICGLPEDEDDE